MDRTDRGAAERARTRERDGGDLLLPHGQRQALPDGERGDPGFRTQPGTVIEPRTRAAGSSRSAPLAEPTSPLAVERFAGNRRFEIQADLGSGAFGTVYRAWDRSQQVAVALKVLHRALPETLFRFKREFRALEGIRHPNLVHLYELFSEGEHWFFSMELVEGTGLLSWVRPDGLSCRADRLRPVLGQLVDGLAALHEHQLLHRDVKPANVLVADDGRAVLLDFGLVREFGAAGGAALESQVVGTPAYIAPEQILHGAVTEQSDWYALGVLLFRALTGRFPFAGAVNRLWAGSAELLRHPPDPREQADDVPDDLAQITLRLLSPDPAQRPRARDIRAALSADRARATGWTVADREPAAEQFVGRWHELARLQSALQSLRAGEFGLVRLCGPSGIGKTTLVRRFLSIAGQQHPELLVLSGRAYEFESVPYMGLDELMDRLSEYLQRQPASRVEALLQRDAALLPGLFPVLGRVEAIAALTGRAPSLADAQEQRSRAFRALRDLFGRLGERRPLVLWLDDVQWADRDTMTFLAELCAAPQALPLLLLLTYRSEPGRDESSLAYLRQLLMHQRPRDGWAELELQQLTDAESQALLTQIAEAGTGLSPGHRALLVHEAGGHPLFLVEMARRVAATGPAADDAATAPGPFGIRALLQRRIRSLPPFAADVLELACIASQPVRVGVLFDAAGAGEPRDRADALALLTRERLIRSIGSGPDRFAEPYHDQVRAAMTALMGAERRRDRHARLAQTLSQREAIEPELLLVHYRESGQRQRTFETALEAARRAQEQLAFDRAAMFLQAALDAAEAHAPQRASITRRLADMLAMAGRGRESADAYLAAAAGRDDEDRLELQRLAADQLLRSGHLRDGKQLFEALARSAGIRLARSPRAALIGLLGSRVRTRARLLRGIPEPRPLPPDPRRISRLELLRIGGIVLKPVDPMQSAYFQSQHLVEALRNGDADHLSTALGLEACIRLSGTRPDRAASEALLERARALAERSGNPAAVAIFHLAKVFAAYLMCDAPEGIRHGRAAVAFYRERCSGASWEMATATTMLFWFLCWAGEVREVHDALPDLLKDGAARGDINLQVSLRLLAYSHHAALSRGRAQENLRDCAHALSQWPHEGFPLQGFGFVVSRAESLLYLARWAEAKSCIDSDWASMERSLLMRWQVLRLISWFTRGRVTLGCWNLDRANDGLQSELRTCIARVRRTPRPWAAPMAAALEAGLAAGRGRRDDAIHLLNVAASGFERASLRALAAATRYHAGLGRADAQGRAWLDEAAAFFASQGVDDMPAYASMLLPLRWAAG